MIEQAVYRFRARGRVQGVAFRAYAQASARDAGVCGWVANHADGSVLGEALGEHAALAVFRAALAEGPLAARVDQVDWEPAPEATQTPRHTDFVIAPDAAG